MMKKQVLITSILVAIAAISAWAQNGTATQNIGAGINVTHEKSWYEQEQFDYYWPIGTTEHKSKLTDRATDPDQIIALLRKIYTDKNIPGIHYAGYGDTQGNNLNSRTRQVYYGGIAGGWDIPGNSNNYTDFTTYKPVEEGYTIVLLAVRDNFSKNWNADHTGITNPSLFNDQNYESLRIYIGSAIEYAELLTDGMRLNEGGMNPGTLFTVHEANINRFFFLSKGQSRDQYHSALGDSDILAPFGRMFEQFSPTDGTQGSSISNYYEALRNGSTFPIQHDCNSVTDVEHFFQMHGSGNNKHEDVSGLQFFIPDYRMKYKAVQDTIKAVANTNEQQIERTLLGLIWGNFTDDVFGFDHFNGEIMDKVVTRDIRTMNYDEGVFLTRFLDTGDEGWVINNRKANLYVTGNELLEIIQNNYSNTYRYRYTGNGNYSPFHYQSNTQLSGYEHGAGYTEYGYYNNDYYPKTAWYRIELEAEPTVQTDHNPQYGEHTWQIHLTWESTVDELSETPLEQTYWVYQIIDGEEVLISDPYGIHVNDLWIYNVEQYVAGRKLTYIVKGKPTIATYPPVSSNMADAIIPGYDKSERLTLTIGSDYYSKYNATGEYNQYCNSVKLENGIGTSITDDFLSSDTKFDVWRTYIDEAGDENTIKVAVVHFSNKNETGINWTITHPEGSNQQGHVRDEVLNGRFTFRESDREVEFGVFEIFDQFQASTALNKHPDQYTYKVTFESATPFEIDIIDENGHVTGTTTTTAVHSNNEIIPVFKTELNINEVAYTEEQITADNKHNISELLPASITFDADGNITTSMNTMNVTLAPNTAEQIYQYALIREPQDADAVQVAQANAVHNQYAISELDANGNMTSKGSVNAGTTILQDEPILNNLPTSTAYGVLISTRPKDVERLNNGDYNTYGSDIKRVGLGKLEVNNPTVDRSSYTWNMNNTDYTYYYFYIPAIAQVPATDRYTFYGWRSWRSLANINLAGEEYQEIQRNKAGGYLYEEELNTSEYNYLLGMKPVNFGQVTNLYGQPQTVNNIESCVFGAKLLQGTEVMDANYKVRAYYSVNNPGIKARELTTPTYYVIDYNLPYTFEPMTPTAVTQVINAKQIVSVTYVSATGATSSKPFSGLNIVVTRFDDGSTATSKQLF